MRVVVYPLNPMFQCLVHLLFPLVVYNVNHRARAAYNGFHDLRELVKHSWDYVSPVEGLRPHLESA